MYDTSKTVTVGQLQAAVTTVKGYADGLAETLEDMIDGYAYDSTTEDLTIPSSFCNYANENLTLY